MQTQATVIYHSGDWDGIFCREIARHFLKAELLTLIGWDYKDPKIPFPTAGTVYVMDLNPECFESFPGIDVAQSRVIWIDHHKTAIDKWGTYLPGYRLDGVAACRLAWQWLSRGYGGGSGMENAVTNNLSGELPCKEYFLERKVSEPTAVMLAGEYDIWDHRGDGDKELQLGLGAEVPEPDWARLFGPEGTRYTTELCTNGSFIQRYLERAAAIKVQEAFILSWQGLRFLALNDASKGSLTFEARDVPQTGHDALMRFYWTGKAWEFSLYHAKHNTDIDLSAIAAKYGGGGHRGACGFRTKQIPFPLYPQ